MARFVGLFLAASIVFPCWGAVVPAQPVPPPSDGLPEEKCPDEIRPLFAHFESELVRLGGPLKDNPDRAAVEAVMADLAARFQEVLQRKQQIHAAKRTGGPAAQTYLNQLAAATSQQATGAITYPVAAAVRDQAWAAFQNRAHLVKLVLTSDPPQAQVQWSPAESIGWRSCHERFAWVAPGRYLVRATLAARVQTREVTVSGAEAAVSVAFPPIQCVIGPPSSRARGQAAIPETK